MKHTALLACLFFSVLIINASCNCKKQVTNPVDKLPPATDTGANTLGCLVNGEVVIIHKPFGDLSPDFGCQYELIYNSPTGYSFNLYGDDKKDGCHFKSIHIALDSLRLQQIVYTLNTSFVMYSKYGQVLISNDCPPAPLLTYSTDSTITGQLNITHFDQQKQIVSGTFWFNAIEQTNGDTVHVTDGRFDMHYTQ